MEISFNIKELLEKNNQVVLPGLGSFHKKRIEGFFDTEKNTFFPPKEIIEFTSSEIYSNETDQNSLISFICTSKNVSSTSAAYILSKYVEDLKKNLETDGEIYFQDIGILKSQNSELKLESEKQEESANSFFGLPSFSLPKQNLYKEIANAPLNFSLAEQALNASLNDEIEDKPKSKTWLFVCLSLIIIALSLSAFYIVRPDLFNSIFNPNLENKDIKTVIPISTPEEQETNIADSIYKDNIVKNLESSGFDVEHAKDSSDISVIKKAVPNKNNIRYEIIIAAWQTRAKAEDHLKKLRENGIDAHIVEDADGLMIKISAATLYNQQDAEKELYRIREELNPEAFIKPIRPLN